MMKKIAFFAILGIFTVAFVVGAQTETTQPQPAASDTKQELATKGDKFSGKIEKFDNVAKTVTVRVDTTGELKVFTYDDKTKFESKDKSLTIENLKMGDKVKIESDASNLALKIHVKSDEMKTEEKPNN